MSISEVEKSAQVTCPFCEHERGAPGQVKVTGDGSFSCDDCGSFWRDLNAGSAPDHVDQSPANPFKAKAAPSGSNARHEHSKYERTKEVLGKTSHPGKFDEEVIDQPIAQARFDGEMETSQSHFAKKAASSTLFDLALIGSTAFVVTLLLIGSLFWFITMDGHAVAKGDILIQNVSFKRSGSGKDELVHVNGTLVNHSTRAYSVPKLRMVLKSSQQGEVHSWIYESAKPSIEPGRKLQFTTLMSSAGMKFDTVEVVEVE